MKTEKPILKIRIVAILLAVVILFTAIPLSSIITAAEPQNLLPNGTFDTDISGWKVDNTGWGSMAWNESGKHLDFTKLSASSGPQIYSEAFKVESNDRIYLEYDVKTNPSLSSMTSVFIYAYTADTIASKGTTSFKPSGDKYAHEFLTTTTDWQTKQLTYTMPEGYEYVQVVFSFRGAATQNTVFSIDNVFLNVVNENFVISKIEKAVAEDNQALFNTWITDSALGIESLNATKYTDYFNALKAESNITKEKIQDIVDSFNTSYEPAWLLPNGTFDSDISGWKIDNATWGTVSWNQEGQNIDFTKTSAASGPQIYSDAVKVNGGDRIYLDYDYKSNPALDGMATVFIYGYTAETVESKGTTSFKPSGNNYAYEFLTTTTEWQTKQLVYTLPEDCEYVQVVFGFRGAAAQNTVYSIDNVYLRRVDDVFVINEIRKAVAADNREDFDTWMADKALGIKGVRLYNFDEYYELLKQESEITKSTIKTIVQSLITKPVSLVANGDFDSGISGWRVSNTGWGSISWNENDNNLEFKKISASSGPQICTEAIKVNGGDKIEISYDHKSSIALNDMATAYIYAYTQDTVDSKGTLLFNSSGNIYEGGFLSTATEWNTENITYTVPEDCAYIQIVIGFRGAVAADTVINIDNVKAYAVNKDYIIYKLDESLDNNDALSFEVYLKEAALGLAEINPILISRYIDAILVDRQIITTEYLQDIIDMVNNDYESISILPNGSFISNIDNWKPYNTSGTVLKWVKSERSLSMTKKASSNSFSSVLMPVTSGEELYLEYDIKTSEALEGMATVFIYAYKPEALEGKDLTTVGTQGNQPESSYGYEFLNTTTQWDSKTFFYTVPTGCEYVQVSYSFRGATANDTVMYLDNINLFRIDEEFCLFKVNEAVQSNDKISLGKWLIKKALGLENVIYANVDYYVSEFKKETDVLSKARIQDIINTVNKEYEDVSLFENGSFDTDLAPWRAYDADTPFASFSAVDSGSAVLNKQSGVKSIMLSELVDVAYGDILHIEFTAKAGRENTVLTLTNSQFTEEECRAFGEQAGVSGKEAANKSSQSFELSTTAKTYTADVRVVADIYGYVASLSLEDGSVGDEVYISDITVHRGTKKLVNSKLNSAIDSEDIKAFEKWMKHQNSDLQYEIIVPNEEFMSNLKAAKTEKGENLTAEEITEIYANRITDIGSRLELMADDSLIDKQNTTAIFQSMKPKSEGVALDLSGGFVCNNIANQNYQGAFDPDRITEDRRPWEHLGSETGNVVKVGDKYYLYYTGVDDAVLSVGQYVNAQGNHDPSVAYYQNVCLAISDDGINWERPNLGMYEFDYYGDKLENNILIGDIMENYEGRHLVNFSVFKDESPNANPEKPYKAMLFTVMARGWGFDLFAYESADGIHWEDMNGGVPVLSTPRSDIMDSTNTVLWSEEAQCYKIFFRKWYDHPEYGEQRGIAVINSDDFINWEDIDDAVPLDYYSDKTEEELIASNEGYYGNTPDSYQLYTNAIHIYERAPHYYLGLPTRYLGNKAIEVAPHIIVGRDGTNYKFWDEQIIEPSEELGRDGNRSNYALGSIFRISETEYAILASRGFKNSQCIMDIFTFRVDGFAAAIGDSSGKTITTTPITFDGDSLILNYKANGGSVKAQLTDIDGNIIEGFSYDDCTALTGDSIDEELKWSADLSKINEPVKISFLLTDAELYSYKFDFNESYTENFDGKEIEDLNDWNIDGTALLENGKLSFNGSIINNIVSAENQYVSVDIKASDLANGFEIISRAGGVAESEGYSLKITNNKVSLIKSGTELTSKAFEFDNTKLYRVSISTVNDGYGKIKITAYIHDYTDGNEVISLTYTDNTLYLGMKFGFRASDDVIIDNVYFSSAKFNKNDNGWAVNDINGDGLFDIRDLVYADGNKTTLDEAIIKRADKNNDNQVSDIDLPKIIRLILGIIS